MSKHFIINPSIESVGEESILISEIRKVELRHNLADSQEQKNKQLLEQEDTLKHVQNRVIIKINVQFKNTHKFEDGNVIRLERGFNNFNRRESEPVNGIVIDAEHIPTNSEILISHNALHDSNRIFGYKQSSETSDIRYFSIPEIDCFAWRENINSKWEPCKGFDFALRVFEPYKGLLTGVDSKLIPNVLYVISGDLNGNVVRTVKAADYQVIYQSENGREQSLIRFRPFGDKENNREQEAICILHDVTDKVNNGELLVGFDIKDCHKLELPINGKTTVAKLKFKTAND